MDLQRCGLRYRWVVTGFLTTFSYEQVLMSSIGLPLIRTSLCFGALAQQLILYCREDGMCRVTIDGSDNATVTSNGTQAGPSIRVYERSNLDPAVEHTIVITVVEAPTFCELDRFV